ncbi:hypothetical protein Kuura_034 [Caulobacter phage Kuura]|nr:hypothetical protein Kuura_034 [Caulobacter phage Kuura]
MTYVPNSPRGRELRALFADNVKEELRVRGWSYRDLAERTGIPFQTISNMVTDRTTASMIAAAFIAKALDRTLDSLLGGDSMRPTLTGPSPEGTVLQCVHTSSHIPDLKVCRECLTKWTRWQARLAEALALTNPEQSHERPNLPAE